MKRGFAESKLFWGVLAVIVVLPIIGLMSQDINISGHAVQPIAYMKAGSELRLEVDDYGVQRITFSILEDVKNSKVTSENLDEVSWDFEGKVYSKFKVDSEDTDNFGDLEFDLKIKDSDLDQVNINRDELNLYFEGEVVDTKLTGIKNGYLYYHASVDKMGEFVIGKAEAVEVVVGKSVEPPKEVIPDVVKEPEVQEPATLPVTGNAVEDGDLDEEDDGFFAWLKGLFG